MSSIQTIFISNDFPELVPDIVTESPIEATTEGDDAEPLPEALYVVTYLTLAIMVVLLMCNAILLYCRLKQKRTNECDKCEEASEDPQEEEASEDPQEKEASEESQDTEENETAEESSSDENTEDTSETSDSDSVQITFEIENFKAKNTVPEGLNESKSENFENCDECQKVFESKKSLMSHIVEEHTATSMNQSEKVETSVEIESENVKNITSASTVINSSENVNISLSSSLLLQSDKSEMSQVSIDMSEFVPTSNLPTNITSASTVILPTQNISCDSNIVNVEEQPDRSKDMFETTSSLVVENEVSKVNASENTPADTLPSRADLKRKSKRRRSGRNKKNVLLTIPCHHCDLSFASEYSLGQHLVMKHN